MKLPEWPSLRTAILVRDEEDTEAAYRAVCADGAQRLDRAALLAISSPDTLVARLRALKTSALDEPCAPFCPQIHLDAAAAIEELERAEKTGSMTNEQFLDLSSRLLGFYGIGPAGAWHRPGFVFRLYWTNDLGLEAAGRICMLAPDLADLLGVHAVPPPTAPEASNH